MVRLIALLFLTSSLFGQNFTSSTGQVSPTLSGTGTPTANSIACTAVVKNVMYYQTDAAIGQRYWQCDGTNWNQNTGVSPYGTAVSQTAITGNMSSQTICPATSSCPAGLYRIDLYIEVATTATGSFTSVGLNYTDDVGAVTTAPITNCTTLTLVSASRCSTGWTFRHAANTTVTLATTISVSLGTPSYSVYAVLTRLQ